MIFTHGEDHDDRPPKSRSKSRPNSNKKSKKRDGRAGSGLNRDASEARKPVEVSLACHDACKKVLFCFTGSEPFAELKFLYYEAFGDLEEILDLEPTCAEYVDEEMPAFELLDPDYGIYYEEFSLSDLFENATIRVNARRLKSRSEITALNWEKQATRVQQEAAQIRRGCLQTPTYASGSVSAFQRSGNEAVPPGDAHIARGVMQNNAMGETWESLPGVANGDGEDILRPDVGNPALGRSLTCPSGLSVGAKSNVAGGDGPLLDSSRDQDIPSLSKIERVKARVWTTMNDPVSSNLAAALTLFIILTIVFSTLVFLIGSYTMFKESNRFGGWFIAETVPAVIFTLEVLARLWSCPVWRTFWMDIFNIVDLVSVVPYYFELIFLLLRTPVPAILRMLRLIRILRLIKISKGSVSVFLKTMKHSMNLLYMLLFMAFLGNLVFASLLYYVERGRWNYILGKFETPSHFLCPVYAAGNATSNLLRDPSVCQPPLPSFPANADYACKYSWRVSPDCLKVHSSGSHFSIWHSTWFIMQTITTVGFGNDMPMTGWGKALSSVVIMFGLVVLSLPITVIGTNFSRTYKAHQRMLVLNQEVMMYEKLSFLQRIAFNLVYS